MYVYYITSLSFHGSVYFINLHLHHYPRLKVMLFTSPDTVRDGAATPSGRHNGSAGDARDPLNAEILLLQISNANVVISI